MLVILGGCANKADKILNAAINFEGNEDYEAAIEILERGIIEYPDHYLMHLNLGADYSEVGAYNSAIDTYTKALQLDSFIVSTYLNIGLNLGRLNEHAEAIKYFDLALSKLKNESYKNSLLVEIAEKLNPTMEEIHIEKAWSFIYLKDHERAIEEFKYCLNQNYEIENSTCNICMSYAELKNKDECCKYCYSCAEITNWEPRFREMVPSLTSCCPELLNKSILNDIKESSIKSK